jgi:hypothetical protein
VRNSPQCTASARSKKYLSSATLCNTARPSTKRFRRIMSPPALTAELQTRCAATREHRTFNVQPPIFSVRSGVAFTDELLTHKTQASRLSGLEAPIQICRLGVNYLDAGQRCGAFLNEGVELVQVDRFYQVMLETHLAAFADILFHPEAGKSDSKRRFRGELLY